MAGFELAAHRGWDVYANRLYEIIYGYLKTAPETRGMVGRPRDIPRVLVELDHRKSLFAIDPGRRDRIELERAEALLHAGLSDEATRSLVNIVDTKANRGIGDVQLLRAAAALLQEDFASARRHAKAAERIFDARDDQVPAGLATLVWLRAFVAGASSKSPNWSMLARHVDEVVARLMKVGLRNEADIARLLGHRVRLHRRELTDDVESILRPRHVSSVDHLILLRLTRADLEIARGNIRAALEHACRGLVELRRHRSWTSGLELVGGSVSYGLELADMTIALVTEHLPTDLGELLDWLELVRTSALRYQPPVDVATSDVRVAEIRRLTENLELARTVDTTPPGHPEIRDKALRYATDVSLTTPPRVSPQVIAALGHRVLVNFMAVADRVYALVVRDGTYHFADICDLRSAVETSRQLHADIDALAPDELILPLREAVEMSAQRRCAAMDFLLLRPLTDLTAGRELIIAPPDGAVLGHLARAPSLTGQTVTVTPSATTWLAGARQPARAGHPLAVMGPDLSELMTDFDNFVVNHPDAVVLSGDGATTSAVLTALDNATVVHLLAHGTHEPTNAAFSRLELYDGGLVAHEIHTLTYPPEHVVRGACELVLGYIRRNDEPLGFAGALLSGGTRTVTASLARVGHRSAVVALSEYHHALTSGLSPAAALAGVTAADPLRRPFVCLGWGG